ncbi:hypothetical protein M378DRAFT_10069 [Amanita muscaria Koide BX008]|uniref:VWFA domain-containing protein n=1 Tax=Amanita muscaria (strain Koide BX008) TaxID=946122 RepID=A0A0C2WX14_AMAMK|nr:hypothetical protein M378DRAFT_10069 [Amanita muscaria Koide BX008]
MQHKPIEQPRTASWLTQAITTSNIFLVLILIMSFIFPPLRPCSLLPRLPLGYEQLDSEWENRAMIFSCRVVSLSRRWFGLFGKPVPTIYCTPSSCTDHKTRNDNAGIAAPTDSSPCQCPDCSDRSSALSQPRAETEALDDSQGSGSRHVVEITSKLTAKYTAAEITRKSAPEETADQEMFQYWVTHSGSGLVDEIANKLGTEKKDIKIDTAKEALTSLKPPPPPSDTVQGYNPWLDKSRPKMIEEYLSVFEVLFVVDDSGSMEGERWTETRDALETIAEKAFEINVDTVSLRFLNDATYVRGLKASACGKNNLTSLFDGMTPEGWTPLGRALKAVFNEHLNRIDTAVEKGEEEYSRIPPLDIIVLTDGVPTDEGEDEPANVITNTVKRLNDNHYHPNTMGVQIVQIANVEEAKQVLKDLALGDNGRVVDTVPYAGIVDSEKLLRILLGGVHPNIRAQLPVAMLAT